MGKKQNNGADPMQLSMFDALMRELRNGEVTAAQIDGMVKRLEAEKQTARAREEAEKRRLKEEREKRRRAEEEEREIGANFAHAAFNMCYPDDNPANYSAVRVVL